MRRWLIEETGEARSPKKGEMYIAGNEKDFMTATWDYNSEPLHIVKLTELPSYAYISVKPKEPQSRFEEEPW